MNWKDCKEWRRKEEEFLNTIDLLPYLEKDKDILDIMDELESEYGEGNQYKEEPYLFNCMDHNEFIDYLKRRYPKFNYYEDTKYRVACI